MKPLGKSREELKPAGALFLGCNVSFSVPKEVLVLAIDSETPARDSKRTPMYLAFWRATQYWDYAGSLLTGGRGRKRAPLALRVARGTGNQRSKGDAKSKYPRATYVHQNTRNKRSQIATGFPSCLAMKDRWRRSFRSADALSLMSNGLHGL